MQLAKAGAFMARREYQVAISILKARFGGCVQEVWELLGQGSWTALHAQGALRARAMLPAREVLRHRPPLMPRQTLALCALWALQDFERADSSTRAQAAINLSTLHLLEGDAAAAAGYADFCLGVEPANPAALVSRGNVHLAAGEAEAALQCYEDALAADPRSLQALYNVGWVHAVGGCGTAQAASQGPCTLCCTLSAWDQGVQEVLGAAGICADNGTPSSPPEFIPCSSLLADCHISSSAPCCRTPQAGLQAAWHPRPRAGGAAGRAGAGATPCRGHATCGKPV